MPSWRSRFAAAGEMNNAAPIVCCMSHVVCCVQCVEWINYLGGVSDGGTLFRTRRWGEKGRDERKEEAK